MWLWLPNGICKGHILFSDPASSAPVFSFHCGKSLIVPELLHTSLRLIVAYKISFWDDYSTLLYKSFPKLADDWKLKRSTPFDSFFHEGSIYKNGLHQKDGGHITYLNLLQYICSPFHTIQDGLLSFLKKLTLVIKKKIWGLLRSTSVDSSFLKGSSWVWVILEIFWLGQRMQCFKQNNKAPGKNIIKYRRM